MTMLVHCSICHSFFRRDENTRLCNTATASLLLPYFLHQHKTQPRTRRNTSLLSYCSLATRCDILSSLFISRGCVPGNRDLNRKDVNRKLLDTLIYLTFVTKFLFYFQIWHIYIYKETTCFELKQFITKSGHKKSRDVNRNDIYRKDL
jgi:hypothetical protein